MKKFALYALVFAVGLSAGLVLKRNRPQTVQSGFRVDPNGLIGVSRVDPIGTHEFFKPHSYSVDNEVTTISQIPKDVPIWLVTFENGRMIVACTPVTQ